MNNPELLLKGLLDNMYLIMENLEDLEEVYQQYYLADSKIANTEKWWDAWIVSKELSIMKVTLKFSFDRCIKCLQEGSQESLMKLNSLNFINDIDEAMKFIKKIEENLPSGKRRIANKKYYEKKVHERRQNKQLKYEDIRKLYFENNKGVREIGRILNISASTVSRIINEKSFDK